MSKRESYEARAEAMLLPIMEEFGYDLVDVEFVKEGEEKYLRAYIDKEGGITLNDCEAVSRRFSDLLDEEDFIDESYIMEVSSPGLDRPLKKEKDYIRNMGNEIEIRTYRPFDKQKKFCGILADYTDDTVTITDGDGEMKTFNKKDIALIRPVVDLKGI